MMTPYYVHNQRQLKKLQRGKIKQQQCMVMH